MHTPAGAAAVYVVRELSFRAALCGACMGFVWYAAVGDAVRCAVMGLCLLPLPALCSGACPWRWRVAALALGVASVSAFQSYVCAVFALACLSGDVGVATAAATTFVACCAAAVPPLVTLAGRVSADAAAARLVCGAYVPGDVWDAARGLVAAAALNADLVDDDAVNELLVSVPSAADRGALLGAMRGWAAAAGARAVWAADDL